MVSDHFSLLLVPPTKIRTVPPYQEETLSLTRECFPNDSLIWRCAFHTSQTGNIHICAPQPIIRKAAHAAAAELQTFWPLI